MVTLEFRTQVAAPIEEVWDFHSDASSLATLTPESERLQILAGGPIRKDALLIFKVRVLGFPVTWHARIVDLEPPSRFVDRSEKGPFKFWQHVHEYIPNEHGTLIRDTISYEPPLGFLGKLASSRLIEPRLKAMFEHRARLLMERFGDSEPRT